MKPNNLLIDPNTEDNLQKKKLSECISKCIINLESLNLSKEEIANRSKIPVAKLLLMENADMSFNIEDYANVARDLAIMLIQKAIDEINSNLPKL
ncbi:hypothetical protein [Lactobacillus huangpiensis]|uniref:hypothetical protein n=1 Tax=Lactobacillus huangpiensis TaxID=2799571 RepID=UPI001CC6D8EA|nr:hypothetical protein [Lactobacillus huangpiensis]